MDNRVKIESNENIVTKASIHLRDKQGEWADVSRCVKGATVTLTVGEVSRAHLDLIMVDTSIEDKRTVPFGFGVHPEPPKKKRKKGKKS